MNLDRAKTIFLIDGSSFLYRAYYGLRPLHTSKGFPVQAVYSCCRMIKKLIDTFNPEYLGIVWDSKGKTIRNELYEAYKATRQAPPSDLFEQKEKIIEFADLIGIKQVAQQGFEADDLLYSLARDYVQEGMTVVLVTSDKDMGQVLAYDRVLLFDAFKDTFTNRQAFENKMAFPVTKLPFYFALLGDTSDNIPGVKGIGEKTATQIVQKYENLDDVYAHSDEIQKPSIKKALLEQKDNAYLSQKLFELQYRQLQVPYKDFTCDASNWYKARPLFEELEFKSLLQELTGSTAAQTVSVEQKIEQLKKYQFKAITTQEALDNLCEQLKAKGSFALDTETDGLDAMQVELVGVSFAMDNTTAYYIPCGHKTNDVQLSKEAIVAALKPILQNPTYKKYGHHIKFDAHVLATHGMHVEGIVFDTLIAASLVTKDWQRLSLKYLSVFYLHEEMLSYEELVKNKKRINFAYVPLDEATDYGAHDALQTLRLVDIFKKELVQEHMDELFNAIEFPLVAILYAMEQEGIYLDVPALELLEKEITADLIAIQEQILALIDRKEINLNSPRQVEELLFYRLNLPPQKKSAKGTGYSTDQEVLSVLAKIHPVPGLILRYRELFKLNTTYVQALPTYVNKRTGRIHTTFNQTGVATGRLASNSPNLQNIPMGGIADYGTRIRAAFKPKKDHLFLSADYSQIELRVLAYLSQDPTLIKAFLDKQDIHKETAAHIFDVSVHAVNNEQRQIGKRINFSILYGLTPYGLSKDLNIPFKDAKLYIEKYFQQYPKVSEWMESIVESAKEKGYVTTHWGRRRYIPAIYEKNKTLYEEARRIAINTVAQGTAAEIMKQGMIALDKALKQNKLDACLLLQIHDELIISVHKDASKQAQIIAQKILESVVEWNVPLEVVTCLGADWAAVSK